MDTCSSSWAKTGREKRKNVRNKMRKKRFMTIDKFNMFGTENPISIKTPSLRPPGEMMAL
jgi:hypothetical protein